MNKRECPQKAWDAKVNTKSSQVKLLITNNAFCIVQRAIARSKTGFFRGYGVAEAPPGFQAGWSGCMFFFLTECSSPEPEDVIFESASSEDEPEPTT
jgi:hypothetical protein